jgi:large subunit ribosomal protein L18
MEAKRILRSKRQSRIRAKVTGTTARPRLSVYKSNMSLYVQLIDDVKGTTIFSKSLKGKSIEKAKQLGAEVGALIKKKGIQAIVFDRGGFRYHGAVKTLADAIREGGIHV